MKYQDNHTDREEERAVSPVIGVILMVAITVILAAVIAAFVLDLGPSETQPTAAIDIDGDSTTEVEVTLRSMDNADGIAVVANDSNPNFDDLDDTQTDVITGTDSSNADTDNRYIETTGVTGSSITLDGDALVENTDDSSVEFDVIVYSGSEPDVTDHINVEAIDNDPSISIVIIDSFELKGVDGANP